MEKGDDTTTTDTPYFRSGPVTVTTSHEIDDSIQTAHSQIHRNIDKWIQNGSNWHINHIVGFYVDVAAYQPMKGKSYIDLPNELKKMKAIINVKNKDDKCLMWALLSALYPAKKNGYDSHHLIGAIGKTDVETVTYTDKDGVCKSKTVGEISVIPNNTEKFISFTWRQFRFIDSCQFLNASLDRLVKTTPDDSFIFTKTLSNHQLLMRKGVYPYEYMNSFSRFDETQLPAQSKFYSSLSDEGVSDDDYKHAETMWMKFDCQTLGDYHDLYLKTDVFLLADIFENFRVEAVRTYQLDPANYYTLPGFAWDALLMYSSVSLELLTDYDQHLFVESGMRGGVSMVSQRYAAAKNHYQEKFDADQPSSFIQYLDANNLYGWAMSQHLPVSDFRWEKPSEKLLNKILNTQDDSSSGYIVECDLVYPHELHEEHNDYPVAPERLSVNEDMLSPYQQELVDKLNSSGVDALKLVPNLKDKTKYVLHYRNLKLYTQLGLRCVKIHRALKFTQTPWMRNYIEKNTDLRKKAKGDFSKDFYKLMNNAVFGKTMENVWRRVNIKLLRSREEKKSNSLWPNQRTTAM
ncbi:uncharacterized protein LOC135827241 [Sycon ciliatum]|uniref:uncharacterized protein LOC135827241 n=1 Tax=Sycon ciliatum TaxID=27933 RepID=UPI0031F6DF57